MRRGGRLGSLGLIATSGDWPGRTRLVAGAAVELRLVARSIFWRLRLASSSASPSSSVLESITSAASSL